MNKQALWAISLIASTLPSWAADQHIEEIIVSAPLAKPASDSALPIAVLSGEALRQEAAASLGDTLSNQIGVHNSSFGSGVGQPIIRGQGGNRVRVLQDSIGSLDAADISPDHSYAVEPLLAQRIEIIRGPATLLYGNGAIGGIVNIIDNRIPTTLPETVNGAIELRHATVNDQNNSVFRLDGGFAEIAWHLDGLYRESNNVDIPGSAIDTQALAAQGEELPEHNTRGYIGNSDTRADGKTIGASWIADSGFIGLSFNRSNSNYGLPPGAHEGHEEEEGEVEGEEEHHDDADIRLDMEQERIDLKSEWQLGGPFQLLAMRLSHSDYQHRELEEAGAITEVGTTFKNKATEGRVVLRHQPFGNWQGAIGIQAGNRDFSAVGEEAFIPKADIRQMALFWIEEYSRNNWTYEFGLRSEQQRVDIQACDRDQSTFSASASALWNFQDDSNLLLAINRSERSPTVEELFSNAPNCRKAEDLDATIEHAATARIELGNPELDKELSHNLELGLRKTAGAVTAELSLYHNEIQNYTHLMDTGAEIDEVKVAEFRQRNAVFSGYEFKVSAPLTLISNKLSMAVFSDHVRARFSDRGYIPRIPAQRYGTALHWHDKNWSSHLRVTQVREQDKVATNESTSDSYTLLELGGDYHFNLNRRSDLTVFITARNLLNETVRSHTSWLKHYSPEAGRDFESGIRLSF